MRDWDKVIRSEWRRVPRKERRGRQIEQRRVWEARTGRRRYWTGSEDTDRPSLAFIWEATTRVLEPSLGHCLIDLLWIGQLSQSAKESLEVLLARTGSPHSGETQVWIDLADQEIFDAFIAYALDSISVEAYHLSDGSERTLRPWGYGGDSWELIYNHDSGLEVDFELTPAELESVQTKMTEVGIGVEALKGPIEGENAIPK